jgi:hypothetical protein
VSVDSRLDSSRPLGHHPPSHRHLPSIPDQRGQLFPGGHERGQLRHGPRRLGKRLPSSDKLRRHQLKPRGAGVDDLSRTPLKPLKLVDPLLVGPLLPSLVDEPGKRSGNLPQRPGPPPNPVRPRAPDTSSTRTTVAHARTDGVSADHAPAG